MDKFVTEKPADHSKKAVNVTAKGGARQFAADTYEGEGKLLCLSCGHILDHTRKSSIASHFSSEKHKSHKTKQEASNDPPAKQHK